MSLHIGILDDDEDVLFAFQAMARTQGWKSLISTNPVEAQRWFAGARVDLLLLDYHLPQMNGMELLKVLKRINASIPVLILTVEENPDLAKSLLMEGADDFISKPIRLADFVARIRVHEKLARSRSEAGWQKSDKGISAETRRAIIDAFSAMPRGATIHDIADATGLAYSTTHRYLDYLYQEKLLHRTNIAESSSQGKLGRPVVRYMLLGQEKVNQEKVNQEKANQEKAPPKEGAKE